MVSIDYLVQGFYVIESKREGVTVKNGPGYD